jgi:peroxiredoxin family protein
MASLLGVLPGMSAIATHMMERKVESFDIPGIPEFMEMIADARCEMYACKASVDFVGFTRDDFISQVQDIITVGGFYSKAAGGGIIFT